MVEEIKNLQESDEPLSKEQKLNWLMNEFGRDVIRLAFTYTKEKQVSEDIGQEVFIRCYQHLDEFRHESSYKTWLFRITINLCRDYFRSWTYKHITISDYFSKSSYTDQTPESEMMALEKNRMVAGKILDLPVKYRELIILYYYEEMSYHQIAETLNISIQTVKTRLHRGRLKLKKSLESERGGLHGAYLK